MTMKLHFEPDLDFQHQAIEAVCGIFKGQEACRTEFTVTKNALGQQTMELAESSLGIGNKLSLLDDQIYSNLKDVQLQNGLAPSESLTSGDFTVEMETGTGKTYVYLRTIFELNKRYGFTKFVIVVPSIAIKEGTKKSLEITEDHFRALYGGMPYTYFLYDSSKLGQVRNFATSANIQIMVVTVGAINKKDVNNLYKESEKTGGERPIDLIVATNPIVIVDEPQSVDGGLTGSGKQALERMNPLCTLRYSATHVDKHHMLYRLDAVDAYERKLVKQIEVASATVEHAFNKPYVHLIKCVNRRNILFAEVELDVKTSSGIKRMKLMVFDGDDLEQRTGRALYANHTIGEISVHKGNAFMELKVPGDQHFMTPGGSCGDVDLEGFHRLMIRRTIQEHLDKELRLLPQGIKVLTLFFIDEVAKYRQYDAEGNSIKGIYAQIFEEEYSRLIRIPKYNSLFREIDTDIPIEEVHNGYFSIDKKGGWTDTAENNQSNRENAERAYNLIMKDKEKLLSLDTPLKFIFSHSALKEGWDNPNVFQICSIRDIRTERERRQTIGRGLRLCVNQQGERVRGFDINTLTVIATESYEEFAENLQKEIEKDTGIRFGIIEKHQFSGITVSTDEGTRIFGTQNSENLWDHLFAQGYIDATGKVQDTLRKALKEGLTDIPEEYSKEKPQIIVHLKKLAGKLDIKNADERRPVKTRQTILQSEDFRELWSRIKHKTTYRVHFDNEKLIQECITAIQEAPIIHRTQLYWRKAGLTIGKGGVSADEISRAITSISETVELPDILTELQNRTQLTRKSLYKILLESRRLNDFRNNPQQFIDIVSESINRRKRLALVDGIKYQRVGDDYYYAQELFEQEELTGYMKNMLSASKSVYESVVYDSDVEMQFAEGLEMNEAVKLYAKLPGWFRILTPLGDYNPDWAVLIEKDGVERLYMVVETKGGLFKDDLREKERGKIYCGKVHFESLAVHENSARYLVANEVSDILE